MEQKLNIAEILKDKPVELKLYSSTFGYIKFNCVHKNKVYFSSEDTNVHSVKSNGKMYDSGECIIFPSKEMRDWNKFSWKKGDVLTNSSGFQIFFDKWANEDYTKFLGKIKLLGNSHCYDTAYYTLSSEEEALEFIKSVEEINNGKLNLETLRIEKPEFKDGDIVVTDTIPSMCYSKCIFILKGDLYTKDSKAHSYVFYNISNNYISFDVVDTLIRDREIRLATSTEKLQLFDILTKKGKYWDAANKQILDLKEYQFKPFEKVLVRDSYEDKWRASFFSNIREGYAKYVTTGLVWKFCIPYEGNEHLLGTTNNVEE